MPTPQVTCSIESPVNVKTAFNKSNPIVGKFLTNWLANCCVNEVGFRRMIWEDGTARRCPVPIRLAQQDPSFGENATL